MISFLNRRHRMHNKASCLLLVLVAFEGGTAVPLFLAGHRNPPFSTKRAVATFSRASINSRIRASINPDLYDETSHEWEEGFSFSAKLVRSLDLAPLIEGVTQYAATLRGRNDLLSLISDGRISPDSKISMQSRQVSKRKSIASMVDLARDKGAATSGIETGSNEMKEHLSNVYHSVKIAESAFEANKEYALVREATSALKTGDKESEGDKLSAPPFYVEPFGETYTDDDEWLSGILSHDGGMILELEHILQADQIVKRLIDTRTWANKPSTLQSAPGISEIACQIDVTALDTLHSELKDSVQIVRKRSISDPTGSRSFTFRLNGSRFPSLGLLRSRERDLMSDLDKMMQGLMRSKAFASRLVGGMEGAEALDLRGRLVVPAKRKSADSLGVVRGYAKKGGGVYVEPMATIEKGDELSALRVEIEDQEQQIMQRLQSLIVRAAPTIEAGMRIICRIDTIFARASYGVILNGHIPVVGEEGRISVQNFVHPVLAEKQYRNKEATRKVVPVDLRLDEKCRSLVISGPNGGGKTVALKSFGIAAAMSKLAIPIPMNTRKEPARVDFFRSIFVEVGDQQSVSVGESTLMARLNSCSSVIKGLTVLDASASNTAGSHALILLDELGGGTDPEAGSAISQAILENILEHRSARTVSTTHAPQLKALSFNDERFHCASVLLDVDNKSGSKYKVPTYKLAYGSIGDSYAFGAASRCTPELPQEVLQRASDIMSGGEEGSGELLRAIGSSLEREKEAAKLSALKAEAFREDTLLCREAIISLARAYEEHLARLEGRLDIIYKDLRDDPSKTAYDLVGDSLAELRHVKKRVKSEQELLAEKGLKMVPIDYCFCEGETVVIIAEGEWEGQTGVVSASESSDFVLVTPSADWGESLFGSMSSSVPTGPALKLKRSEIAVWDYPDNDWDLELSQPTKSVSASKQRLFSVLSKIQSGDEQRKHVPSRTKDAPSFKSSRERKAAAATTKKGRKSNEKRQKKK